MLPYEKQFKDLTEWTEKEILEEISTQFRESEQNTLQKKTYWTEYIKLYLNQERKKIGDLAVGSNLLFSQFNDIYASIDNDDLLVSFKERNPRDAEVVQFTNWVARFDFEEMNLSALQRELFWDVLFFGTGLYDVSEYDKKRKVIKVRLQSPFTFFIDPLANSIEEARYAGRYVYMTPYDLMQDERLDPEKVKKILSTSSPKSIEKITLEERAKNILLLEGYNYFQYQHSNAYLEILEWYMYANGKLWVVWTDNGITTILGFKELKYEDGGSGKSKIPFVAYYYIKTPRGFWGIGIPDILESAHRTAVYLQNLMLQGIRIDVTPSFLINLQAVHNPRDLLTREINKIVWTKVPPAGQIQPFPKTQAVSSDVLAFYNMIINEAMGAIGSQRILRGSLGQIKKTATEVAIAKAKQDLQIASHMRNILRGERDFWYRWLKRHKKFLSKDDTKLVEIIGTYGAKQFVEVRKEDFIPAVDPIIEITSSLVAEPTKIVRRRDLAEVLPLIGEMGGNPKAGLKMILRDMDLSPEQIDILLPPSPHQIKARKENELLEEGIWVDIDEQDNDNEHLEEHYKLQENDVVRLHIEAHIKNILLKQRMKQPQPAIPAEGEIPEEEIEMGTPQEVQKELTKEIPIEGIEALRGAIRPSMPQK